MTESNVINLEDYRAKSPQIAKVLTGRPRGKEVRLQSRLDEIEAKFDQVEIIIPDNIYSINPSFFEELFLNTIKKLGKDKFLEKFKFRNLGKYNYETPLLEAIERVLRRQTALD